MCNVARESRVTHRPNEALVKGLPGPLVTHAQVGRISEATQMKVMTPVGIYTSD